MKKSNHLYRAFLLTATIVFCALTARAQTASDIYNGIKLQPSIIRWCVPEAGDDPAHIIEGRCKVYQDCLAASGFDESIDRNQMPPLPVEQVVNVRKCHQALFNAARSNPQVKGSAATQQWLQHAVYPGTEAKPFPIPNNLGNPR
jgi:hypothetical protein